MAKLSKQYGLGFCNVFHAGDGNLHPLIMFDVKKEGEFERAEAFGADILRLCVKVGGVLSGEHGVGIEKRDLMTEMFTEADLEQQHRVKCAFDSAGPVQSRQGVSHPVGLCRAGPYPCPWRATAPSASAALLMAGIFPRNSGIVDFVRAARADKSPFEIVARRHPPQCRQAAGRTHCAARCLGPVRHPEIRAGELILTAAPATPLAEIVGVLARSNQRLGFDPADWSRCWARRRHAGGRGDRGDVSGSGRLRPVRRATLCWAFMASTDWARRSRGGGKW